MASDGNTILANLDNGNLSGIQLEGSFSMVSQDAIDASNIDGQVATLVLKLKETDRGTGSYQTISAAAFLEVDVDMNLIHSFNPSSGVDNLDDSHALGEAHVGTDPAIEAAKRALGTQFRLDLNNYLAAGNLAANTNYDSATKILSSDFFPAGAIVLDLDSQIDQARLSGNVQITDANDQEKTFLVAADQLEAGVMMYARVKIDCSQSMPQISGEYSFQPTGNVIGGDNGSNADGIKIVLTGLDNYSLAQVLTVSTADGTVGSIGILEEGAPLATTPDDFVEVIQLSDLIGTGTVGEHMGNAVVAAIGTNAALIKSFKLQVDAVAHQSDSSFSGFCRELAKAADRTNDNPFKAGDKFIINNTGSLQLNVQPFQYSFADGQGQISGTIHQVQQLQMFKSDMPVYAVLKQSATPAPMMKTLNGDLWA